MEPPFNPTSTEVLTPSDIGPLRVALNGEWQSEIESNARADVGDLGWSSEEVDEYVREQLGGASEITESVLRSDVFLDSREASLVMQAHCPGITAEEVRILGDLGYLLSLPVANRNLYPLFQFDSDGQPLDIIKTVRDLQDPSVSVWGNSVWWFLHHPRLRGDSPAHWLRTGGDQAAVAALFGYDPVVTLANEV